MTRWIILAVILNVWALAAEDDVPAGRKYALVVGVQKYEGTGLENLQFTENDANGLAQVLRGEGYAYNRVVLLTHSEARKLDRPDLEPTAQNIRDQLVTILKERRPKDTVLIAFSGHGFTTRKRRDLKSEIFDEFMCFCPQLCKLNQLDTLITIDEIYKEMGECKANTKVLLVDACREGAKGSVTCPVIPDPPGGMVAMFSCAKGQVARERDGYGYMFKYVIEGLKGNTQVRSARTGEIKWLKLVGYVADEVKDHVHDDYGAEALQTPDVRGDSIDLVLG